MFGLKFIRCICIYVEIVFKDIALVGLHSAVMPILVGQQ